MKRRGFSLVELLIASGIGAFVVLAGVAFAGHQTRLLGVTSQSLELNQTARFALDRLAADLRMAGEGVGYDETGAFIGLELGTFQRGGATFQSNNRSIALGSNVAMTDDIGLSLASAGYSTIAAFNYAGSGQLCRGSGFKQGDVVLLRSEDGLSARTVSITNIAPALCGDGVCTGGCDAFSWTADPTFTSGPDATAVNYGGGEAAGGFRRVAWFVEANNSRRPGTGRLRRLEGDCDALDESCGETIAEGVESLQMRVMEWRDGAWVDLSTNNTRINSALRLKVDLEIVVRSRKTDDDRIHDPVTSRLEPSLCFPVCGSTDKYQRQALSTSVEIKNSGRVSYRRQQ